MESTRPRLRRVLRWVGRGLLLLGTLILIAAIIGWRWERAEHRAFLEAHMEPPGEMVSVGDHEVHVVTEGDGSPGILFIAGLGDDYRGWRDTWDGLADSVRRVAYDRPGFGWSPPAVEDPDLPFAVADVRALISDRQLFDEPPVLVGHSLGGMIAREVALEDPELVAGLVLIDATPPDPLPGPIEILGATLYRGVAVLGRTGVTRLVFYRTYPDATRQEQLRWAHLDASGAKLGEVWRELQEYRKGNPTPHAPGTLGDLPLTVLSAAPQKSPVPGVTGYMASLDAAKRDIATESGRSRFIQTETGHYIHREDPETVVDEILRMVREVRSAREAAGR